MRTNIDLDDDLVGRAMRVSGARTKREVVELALKTLIAERERLDLGELRGRIRFRKNYDPRQARAR